MKLLKLILVGAGVAFGILGCAILLRCVFLAFGLGDWEYGDFTHYLTLGKNAETGQVEFTEYPTGEAPWFSFFPAWLWGLACLGVSGLCLAAKRLAGKLRRWKPFLKKLAMGFAALVAVLIAILVLVILEERIRGKIALHSYLRELRGHGEKLTLADFDLSKPPAEHNGAPALLALTNQFESLRQCCPFEPGITISTIKLVLPGRGLLRSGQPNLGVYIRRSFPAEPGRGRQSRAVTRLDETGETNVTVIHRADWTDLQEQMLRASNTLEQIRAALSQPALSATVDYSQGLDVKLPHLAAARTAATWLEWSALNDLHHHDLPAVTKDIEAFISLTRFQKNEKLLISQIIRQRIAETGLAVTWEALQTNGWTEAQLIALQQAWQSFSVIQDVLPTAEMDRVFYHSLFEQVRHSLTWNEIRTGSYNWRGFFEDIPGSIHGILWPLAWLDHDELRFWQRRQLMLDHAREAVSQRAWTAFALSDKDFPYSARLYDRWRYVLSNDFPPPWETAVRHMFQFESQREMTVAAIAIKRYQLCTGKLPDDLATLVPEYLPQVPHDWMDGQTIRYHPNPDGTFTLYSVGVDGQDDGGDPVPAGTRRAISIWDGRDAIWPMPASAAEIADAQPTRQTLPGTYNEFENP